MTLCLAFLAPVGLRIGFRSDGRGEQPSHCAMQKPAPRWRCASTQEINITAPDGGSVAACMVSPSIGDVAPSGRGVVLYSDVLGYQNEAALGFATSLCEFGISVIIPDLFRGKPWTKENADIEYESWRAQHHPTVVMSDARLAADELRRNGMSVGLLGFCYGGGMLMNELALGSRGSNPSAAVVFYPTRFHARTAGKLAECPLMAVFADKDKQVPMSVVDELREGLNENDVMEECELLVYDGSAHGFAHRPKTPQDEDDSDILKFQTMEWFNNNLPGINFDESAVLIAVPESSEVQ